MQIRDHVFITTGGASGLGAACAQRFSKAGAHVVIADLNADAGKKLAASLGPSARSFVVNVADEKNVLELMAFTIKEFGALHGVINCAGLGTPERMISKEGAAQPLESFAKIIRVNLIGTFNVDRLAAEAMIKHPPNSSGERGVIIHTASVAAFDGQIGQTAYSASKGGVVGMTLPMARELAFHGIRVATIAPGIFDTPMLAGLPEPARESLGKQVPFPSRLGKPEEYAALAQHIVENEMINGEVIRLDGALRMGPK